MWVTSEPRANHSVAAQDGPHPDPETSPRSLGRRVRDWALEGTLILVGAIVIASLLRAFVGQMFIIPSGSMENTLQIDDRVLVSKFGGFHRGDVVVFEDPGHWLPVNRDAGPGPIQAALEFVGVLPNSADQFLIKRVIGMPGDHVCTDGSGKIVVNGFTLDEKNYLYSQDGIQVTPSELAFNVVVPEGRVFVMGDHRDNSNDSRYRLSFDAEDPAVSAFVPETAIVGAAVAIVSPLDRMATFQIPASFTSVPDPETPAPTAATVGPIGTGCK